MSKLNPFATHDRKLYIGIAAYFDAFNKADCITVNAQGHYVMDMVKLSRTVFTPEACDFFDKWRAADGAESLIYQEADRNVLRDKRSLLGALVARLGPFVLNEPKGTTLFLIRGRELPACPPTWLVALGDFHKPPSGSSRFSLHLQADGDTIAAREL